jgi:hypothetical protein
MALVTANANIARQKAYNAVYGTGTGTTADSVSPFHFYAVKAFFLHMAINKGNPDLQFLPYTAEQAIANGGTDLVGAGCTLYAWYGKARRTSATTVAFQAIHDAADNSATTTTVDTVLINLTGQQFFIVHPNGKILATGLTISSADAVGGATETTALLATDGFIIVGA